VRQGASEKGCAGVGGRLRAKVDAQEPLEGPGRKLEAARQVRCQKRGSRRPVGPARGGSR